MGSVQPDVSRRTVRAATEEMTVFEEARALFEVIAETGKIYTVDLVGPACTCHDFEYRNDVKECKHIRRVRVAVGQVDLDALADELERTASELETSAEQLERRAQDIHDEASGLKNATNRLQEVRL